MENLNDIDREAQAYYENTPQQTPFHLSVVTEATVCIYTLNRSE